MIKVKFKEIPENFQPYKVRAIQEFLKGQILCNPTRSVVIVLTSVNHICNTMTCLELSMKSLRSNQYSGISLTELKKKVNDRELYFVKDLEMDIKEFY